METQPITFELLCYQHPDLRQFHTTVMACQPWSALGLKQPAHLLNTDQTLWGIALKQTAFYPEGGGQPSDRGVLRVSPNQVLQVHDVQRLSGVIWHALDIALPLGTPITGEVEDGRRRDLSVQHTAEHLLSGLIRKLFGYNNVGFHLSDTEMTLDFDAVLTDDQLEQLLMRADELIAENRPVTVTYQNEDTPNAYRSKKALEGEVRVVTIPDVDVCACCGTHVSATGEIGAIEVVHKEKIRGGSRLTVLAGARARRYLHQLQRQAKQVGQFLSCPVDQTAAAVFVLQSQLEQCKDEIKELQKSMHHLRISTLPANLKHLALVLPSMDAVHFKALSQQVLAQIQGVLCVILPHARQSGYQYLILSRDRAAETYQAMWEEPLKLKGGGRTGFFQGVTAVSKSDFEQFIVALPEWTFIDWSPSQEDGS